MNNENTFMGRFGYKCPHPDCHHMGDIITKAHCLMEHGMEREELYEKYGEPKEVAYNLKRLKQNITEFNSYVNYGR